MRMKPPHIIAIALLALSLAACATHPVAAQSQGTPPPAAAAGSDLAAFPAARADQTRHVIRLPQQADESLAKVELIVGRTMQVDCNTHFFGARLETRTAEGWGYDYFVLDSLGQAASTLMGCPNGSEHMAFVRSSAPTMVRYNSRLPLVVYTPRDVEVRYRIWRAEAEQRTE